MNAYPLSVVESVEADDSERMPDPMPATVTRRKIKAYKARIAKIKRAIQAEEKRIALNAQMLDMERKLRELREKGHKSY